LTFGILDNIISRNFNTNGIKMKLYKVPRHTLIKISGTDVVVKFHHIDGMYSYCTTPDGQVTHLVASTEVEIIQTILEVK
jgi:hypothetical protein